MVLDVPGAAAPTWPGDHGPLGDRGQAARTGTHRRCGDGKNPGQVVAATTTSPKVSDGGEHAQQRLAADRHGEG